MKVHIPKLNDKQYSIIREEVEKEFSKHLKKYNRDSAMQLLHILHFEFRFGQKRLQRFADLLCKMQEEQLTRYELSSGDTPWLCERQLKGDGIDVDALVGGDNNAK
jgi:hypothetical protein